MSNPLFSLESITYGYHPEKLVLRDIGLQIHAGDLCGVIGPNGAGKSTLLSLLAGTADPLTGSICYNGKPVHQWRRRDFARQVAVVPQREFSPFEFTVRDIVLMGRFVHQQSAFSIESHEDHEVVSQVLEWVDLADLADRPIGELSGGERQRSLLARALAQQTPTLLLDEPTTALDPLHQRLVMDLLVSLSREQGKTIIIVSHDLSLMASYTDRTIVIRQGKVYLDGSTASVMKADNLRDIYGTPMGVHPVDEQTVLVGVIR
jgi:iron complex transport system ATP-binding protein